MGALPGPISRSQLQRCPVRAVVDHPDLDRTFACGAPARSECGRAFPPESELIPPEYVGHRVHYSLTFSRRRMQAAARAGGDFGFDGSVMRDPAGYNTQCLPLDLPGSN
jgi:hypothetical protein